MQTNVYVTPTAVKLEQFYRKALSTSNGRVMYTWMRQVYLPRCAHGGKILSAKSSFVTYATSRGMTTARARTVYTDLYAGTLGLRRMNPRLAMTLQNRLTGIETAAVTANVLAKETVITADAVEDAIETVVDDAVDGVKEELNQMRSKLRKAENLTRQLEEDNAKMRQELEEARNELSKVQELMNAQMEQPMKVDIPPPPPPPPIVKPSQQLNRVKKDIEDVQDLVNELPAKVDKAANHSRNDLLAQIRAGGVKLRKASEQAPPPMPENKEEGLMGALSRALRKRRGAIQPVEASRRWLQEHFNHGPGLVSRCIMCRAEATVQHPQNPQFKYCSQACGMDHLVGAEDMQ